MAKKMKPHVLMVLPPELIYFVCRELESPDLARVARTCKHLRKFAERALYLRNAAQGNSSAILWVVEPARAIGECTFRTLRLAHRYCLDFNASHTHASGGFATALHVAAGREQPEEALVRMLLRYGADIQAPSRGLSNFIPRLERRIMLLFRNHSLALATLGATALPLFAPSVWENSAIVSCLMREHGAPFNLTARASILESIYDTGLVIHKPPLTVLHTAAFWEDEDFASTFVHEHGTKVNKQALGTGYTALSLAVGRGNLPFATALVERNADVSIGDGFGMPPLHSAISSCAIEHSTARRNVYLELITMLISNCADVNQRSQGLAMETPLLSAARSFRYDWGSANRQMKIIFDLLISKGADLNASDAAGNTVLMALCRAIIEQPTKSLEKYLEYLVEQGADVNQPVHHPVGPRRSLLGFAIRSPYGSVGLTNLLIRLGARIEEDEAVLIFRRWAHDPKRLGQYNVGNLAVPPKEIDAAIIKAFKKSNFSVFWRLMNHFEHSVDGTRFVWEALAGDRKVLDMALALPHNAKSIDPYHGTFLHRIASLVVENEYQPGRACADARHFISRGARIDALDKNGQTALQILDRKPRAPASLRHLLGATEKQARE